MAFVLTSALIESTHHLGWSLEKWCCCTVSFIISFWSLKCWAPSSEPSLSDWQITIWTFVPTLCFIHRLTKSKWLITTVQKLHDGDIPSSLFYFFTLTTYTARFWTVHNSSSTIYTSEATLLRIFLSSSNSFLLHVDTWLVRPRNSPPLQDASQASGSSLWRMEGRAWNGC